ncbi:MAG: phage holin family protein, partial [Pseudomonadota bacterium]
MFIAHVLITMISILIIAYFLPNIIRVDGVFGALAASFILSIVNAVIRPILIFLTLPFTILTLGFFLLVINGFMLGLVAFVVPGFYLNGLAGAIAG